MVAAEEQVVAAEEQEMVTAVEVAGLRAVVVVVPVLKVGLVVVLVLPRPAPILFYYTVAPRLSRCGT